MLKYLRKMDTMKILGRLLGCLLAITAFFFAAPVRMTYASTTPPPYTTSWYMDSSSASALPTDGYNLGCALGTKDLNSGVTQNDYVTLLFGEPAYYNGTYGSWDWPGQFKFTNFIFVSDSQIASTVEQFAYGYWFCTGTNQSQLHVAAGVNNQGYGNGETSGGGSAWESMTASIYSWVATYGYNTQVSVRAAADMEPNYNSFANTSAWVNGYANSYTSPLYLYDVGSASGCPLSGPDTANSPCNNSWTVYDVWYVAYGPAPEYAIPEIYNTGGWNGVQWGLIDNYQYIYFVGEVTQQEACGQPGATGCSGLNYSPSQGWNNLMSNINTHQSVLYGSTDMKWQ